MPILSLIFFISLSYIYIYIYIYIVRKLGKASQSIMELLMELPLSDKFEILKIQMQGTISQEAQPTIRNLLLFKIVLVSPGILQYMNHYESIVLRISSVSLAKPRFYNNLVTIYNLSKYTTSYTFQDCSRIYFLVYRTI